MGSLCDYDSIDALIPTTLRNLQRPTAELSWESDKHYSKIKTVKVLNLYKNVGDQNFLLLINSYLQIRDSDYVGRSSICALCLFHFNAANMFARIINIIYSLLF